MADLSPIFPLFFNDQGSYASNTSVKDVVKQNFKNLLLTSPGERIMLPNFGIGLKNFLFEQNSDAAIRIIREQTDRQIATYMPFIKIQEFSSLYEENQLIIIIKYFILPLSDTDILSIKI